MSKCASLAAATYAYSWSISQWIVDFCRHRYWPRSLEILDRKACGIAQHASPEVMDASLCSMVWCSESPTPGTANIAREASHDWPLYF